MTNELNKSPPLQPSEQDKSRALADFLALNDKTFPSKAEAADAYGRFYWTHRTTIALSLAPIAKARGQA